VFGAQAVALYGVPRLTDDLDVTLELGDRNFSSIARELTAAGQQRNRDPHDVSALTCARHHATATANRGVSW
jgi:hypothetical protein